MIHHGFKMQFVEDKKENKIEMLFAFRRQTNFAYARSRQRTERNGEDDTSRF
ncbi:hypothetical protein LEP1GSC123_4029 [Leptospira borgpetersenii str. 200701203]|uniref:Uncharacterized protein n=1 Tax=Leptospira borgpetersenii str. 200701203 TaxID=1193007 RepID=M3HKJ3_LEPBO|nr:hypothetical protein LEP1GSC123_4029 [Leptospira borgpetersenii str. 200701203]